MSPGSDRERLAVRRMTGRVSECDGSDGLGMTTKTLRIRGRSLTGEAPPPGISQCRFDTLGRLGQTERADLGRGEPDRDERVVDESDEVRRVRGEVVGEAEMRM